MRVTSRYSGLVVDVDLLNGRRPAIYDFSRTGAISDDDADPGAYEVDAAGLGLTSVAPAGDRGVYALRVHGDDEIRLFASFSAFSATLPAEMEVGERLRVAVAHGRYNGELGFTTGRAAFGFVSTTDMAQ